MTATVEPLRKPVKCPNCDGPSHRKHYPFCSKRCSEMDLHRWFSGGYRIAANEPEPLDEE